MGSSSSIFSGSCDIYISYDNNKNSNKNSNKEIHALCSELEKEKLRVVCSNDSDFSEYETEKQIEFIESMMSKTRLFIICISPESFSSFKQNIEWNYALKGNRKIVYLIRDGNYSPSENGFLQYLIRNKHRWFSITERYLASEIISLLNSEE
jgi:hypothetical protein